MQRCHIISFPVLGMGNEIDYLEQFGTSSVSIVLKCFVCFPGWVERKLSSLKCFCEVTLNLLTEIQVYFIGMCL